MYSRHTRTLSILVATLMTLAMLAGIRAGFEVPQGRTSIPLVH